MKGRPSKYSPRILPRVQELAEAGKTEAEIAAALGVSRSTLKTWKGEHPAFLATLKDAKDVADEAVENALFRRACGFVDSDGTVHPPHPVAAIFWLKNRRPDVWRDTSRTEITGKDGGPVESINYLPDDRDRDAVAAWVEQIRRRVENPALQTLAPVE